MKNRLLRPISLKKIECILSGFSVVRDQSFIINSVVITFFSKVRPKIEHVPDKRAPDKGSIIKYLEIFFMIK